MATSSIWLYGAAGLLPLRRNNQTVNDSPEAATMSWEISTTPVDVPNFKPTAHLVIDSTKTDKAQAREAGRRCCTATDGDQATRTHASDAREGHRAAEGCRLIHGTRTSKAGLSSPRAPAFFNFLKGESIMLKKNHRLYRLQRYHSQGGFLLQPDTG